MRSLMAVLAIFLLAGFMTPSSATVLPIEGGPGGGYFAENCAPGQYVVGFSVKAGAWIDSVAILCAPSQPNGKFGNPVRSAFHGGSGGSPQEQYCPTDTSLA